MKRIVSLIFAFAGLILLPVSFAVNHSSSNHTIVADGGQTVPPWPTGGPATLVADGGTPVPPWPTGGPATLVADGGTPVPPWPTGIFAPADLSLPA
jgi:hypothetical protein